MSTHHSLCYFADYDIMEIYYEMYIVSNKKEMERYL